MTDSTTRPLPRSTPEAEGASSSGLSAFIGALGALGEVHSVMVLRHGSVIAEHWWEPYGPNIPHSLFSVSKSFTSTAIGFAVAEGLLSIDDRVVDLLPDDAPEAPSAHLNAMRVRDLLTMTTGHAVETLDAVDRASAHWTRTILAQPVEFEPGTHFLYNSGATHVLSAIITKLTGSRLIDYLEPRLFTPLGINGASWEQTPEGIDAGAYGLSATTEDVAKFGQLYLQRGEWNGTQLLPAAWVDEATSALVPNQGESIDWLQGYGLQFWRGTHNTYRGDGIFGQYCIVLPDLDAVIVMTAGTAEMRSAQDAVWEHALLALGGVDAPPVTLTTSVATLGGTVHPDKQAWFFPTNPLKILNVVVEGATIRIDGNDIPFGQDAWVKGGRLKLFGAVNDVAAAGGWQDDGRFVVQLRPFETPFTYTFSFTIDDGTVDLVVDENPSFGATRVARLIGGVRQ